VIGNKGVGHFSNRNIQPYVKPDSSIGIDALALSYFEHFIAFYLHRLKVNSLSKADFSGRQYYRLFLADSRLYFFLLTFWSLLGIVVL